MLYLDSLSRPKVSRLAMVQFHKRFFDCHLHGHLLPIIPIQGRRVSFTSLKEILQLLTWNIYEFSLFFEDFVFLIQRILKHPWIQMAADWSCTVLAHNRTCCGKYRISLVSIDLCCSLISADRRKVSRAWWAKFLQKVLTSI